MSFYTPTAEQVTADVEAAELLRQVAIAKGRTEAEAEAIVGEVAAAIYRTRATGDKSHYATIYHKHLKGLMAN